MTLLATAVAALAFLACAQGTTSTGDDDPAPDARVSGGPDASPGGPDGGPGTPDARPPDARPPDARPPDARPPDARPPDAAPPDAGGLFCTANENCAPSDCCFVQLCVPGTRVGSLCVPA